MKYKDRLILGVESLDNAYDELPSSNAEKVAELLGCGDIVVGAVAYALSVTEEDLINAAIKRAKERGLDV